MDATSNSELQTRLGAQLRALRIAADITQAELATRASVSTPTIIKLEAGQGGRISVLVTVLRVLGRSDWIDTLAPGFDQPSPLELLRRQRRRSPVARRVGRKG